MMFNLSTWWNLAIDLRYSRCLLGVAHPGSNSRQPTTSKMVSSLNMISKSAFLLSRKMLRKISYRWWSPSIFSKSCENMFAWWIANES